MSQLPWDMETAQRKAVQASDGQAQAEEFIRTAAKDAALKEEAYRVSLANRIVELRAAGQAATNARDLARGDKQVAARKREAMIADGVRDAAVQAAWRKAADRRDTERLIDWSMRRELAEGRGRGPTPEYESVIGGKRA